ncbi:hypothetical protein ACFO1B_45260 [Dactylosporangium siamense]|uniref:Integral membrane protein n=1 Tax=Dactylosporangium siamense TaxID=685454 RepID=A0A919UGJ4_9ACTN|nr:hypothetical protein [Dactylosporangium siamense]GIG51371.1 hypothetical protein Dsi01nite_094120 [Dactylosporangium siamense]
MKWVLVIVGALLVLSGVVWTLQGLNLLGGSAMSGNTMWAVIGPITAIVGAVLFLRGVRKS